MKKLISYVLCLVLVVTFSLTGIQKRVSAKNDRDNEIKLRVFVHEPNPHGRAVLTSACTQTVDDSVNDYGETGWHMPSLGMNYKINYSSKPSNLSNSQVENVFTNSFATWSSTDANQIFNYTGSTSVSNARLDGTNAVLWKKINRSAIAITYVWYYSSTGESVETDTIFNKSYKWSATAYDENSQCGGVAGTYDLENIATHEFGHWIGLDDLYDSQDQDLTMYGYGETTELKKDTLGAGDILGVNAIQP